MATPNAMLATLFNAFKMTFGARCLIHLVSDLPLDSRSVKMDPAEQIKTTARAPKPSHGKRTQKPGAHDGSALLPVSASESSEATGLTCSVITPFFKSISRYSAASRAVLDSISPFTRIWEF